MFTPGADQKDSKKRKFEALSPEEQSDFQELFLSCLRKPEVIQTFKDVITDCVKDLRIRELETTVSKLERRIEDNTLGELA